MKNAFFLLLGILLILGSFYIFIRGEIVKSTVNPQLEVKTVSINATLVEVELAETDATRVKGLSGRTSLEEGKGMLFIFDTPSVQGFWMKEMNFSIDIIWIDENLTLVGVEKSVAPETFPQVYSSKVPVKYVLEVPAGFSERNNIDIGSRLYLEEKI